MSVTRYKPVSIGGFTLVTVKGHLWYIRNPNSDVLYCGRDYPLLRLSNKGYGNPHAVGKRCKECGQTHATATDTLEPYRQWLRQQADTIPGWQREFIATLTKYKKLACFCSTDECHTRIMIEEWLRITEVVS